MTISVLVLVVFLELKASGGVLMPGQQSDPKGPFVLPLLISDFEKTGWDLVFRATAGNGHNVYDAWTTGVGTSSAKPTNMQRSDESHYRDPKVDQWNQLDIKYARLSLFKQSVEVAYIVFHARGSDYMNWFSDNRVVSSSWTDLSPHQSFNIFSIAGIHSTRETYMYYRSFYILLKDSGCNDDLAYMGVVELEGVCNWDVFTAYPQFVYSDMGVAERFNNMMFGRADYMAVFVYPN